MIKQSRNIDINIPTKDTTTFIPGNVFAAISAEKLLTKTTGKYIKNGRSIIINIVEKFFTPNTTLFISALKNLILSNTISGIVETTNTCNIRFEINNIRIVDIADMAAILNGSIFINFLNIFANTYSSTVLIR
jgi:hypothetical protein